MSNIYRKIHGGVNCCGTFFSVSCQFYQDDFLRYSSGTSVQIRASVAQESKRVGFTSESLEQHLSCAVQIRDQVCGNAHLSRQVVATTSVVWEKWQFKVLVCSAVLPSHLAWISQAMLNYQDTIPRAMGAGNSKMLESNQMRQKGK